MIIRRRSKAREVALQALFQLEVPRRFAFPFDEFISRRLIGKDQGPFCRILVMGTRGHHREIDRRISEAAENWRLERMAGVDRNIIRMGAFELLFQTETAAKVILDEAVELAKRFGSEDSPKFVNGVLDQLLRGIPARASEVSRDEPSPVSLSTSEGAVPGVGAGAGVGGPISTLPMDSVEAPAAVSPVIAETAT